MSDQRLGWPSEWLAFELLRRREDYRRAWREFCDGPSELDPNGWAVAFARSVDPTRDTEEWFRETFGLPLRLIHSRPYAGHFGLEYLLDPDKDAATHAHIPWRPEAGPARVEFERGPEEKVLDPTADPPQTPGLTRFVTIRFDLGRPVGPQLAKARALLQDAQQDVPTASRGRSAYNIVSALRVLDLRAAGATNREIGEALSAANCDDPADRAKKLLRTACKLSEDYLSVAAGVTVQGVGYRY